MCTIAILVDVLDGAPIVIAANRDEMYARPTRPPERLVDDPRVVGGLDELSGGTWLALRRDGRFAAVTNQRALATPPPGLRSRGLAVKECAAAGDPDAYVAALDPAAYASMNLVWNSPRGVSIAYARREAQTLEVERLGRGVHVLCNDRLGAPDFPRGDRLGEAIARAIGDGIGWPKLAELLATLLADHTRVDPPDSNLPPHLSPELARELTATCIHSPFYGTRSSTIVAIDGTSASLRDAARPAEGGACVQGRVIDYRHADGPPCTTPYHDLRDLL